VVRIVLAAFQSLPASNPPASHRKVLIPNPKRVLFIDAQLEQVIVVQAGGTNTTVRPARVPRWIS
jgi:hypothetical protein